MTHRCLRSFPQRCCDVVYVGVRDGAAESLRTTDRISHRRVVTHTFTYLASRINHALEFASIWLSERLPMLLDLSHSSCPVDPGLVTTLPHTSFVVASVSWLDSTLFVMGEDT